MKKQLIKQKKGLLVVALGLLLFVLIGVGFIIQGREVVRENNKEAVDLVAQLSEVQEFRKAVAENGRSTFHIELEDFALASGPGQVVRVFEVFSDHQTTFNRYRVDSKDGKIYRMNIVEDGWEIVQ